MNKEYVDIEQYAANHFTAVKNGEIVIDEESLRSFWMELCPSGNDESDALVNVVESLAVMEDPTLLARSAGWTYKLGSGMIKGMLLASVVTVTLLSVGATGLSAAIIPAVLPFLFDLERTKLSRKQEKLLVELTSTVPEAEKKTTLELYSLLPEEIQNQVNYLDFEDFMESIKLTGHAIEYDEGMFELRALENPQFCIHFL